MFDFSFVSLAATQSWSGGEAPVDWVEFLGPAGAILFGAILLWLLVRAFLQRNRYRAVDLLGEGERQTIAAEIAGAERETSGEIAVVVLERSDRHPAADWLACVLFLSVGSALLAAWIPWDRPLFLFALQLLLGAAGFLASRSMPGFKRFFIREERATEMAAEQALQEFYAAGLHRTKDATGVLLFVSLLERRVIVLGDEGIDAKLDEAHWQETDQAILDAVRRGALGIGLVEGVRRCAAVLAEHFPAEGENPDEVPDHVIVRRE
jgi:putative membrane protein